MQNPFVALTSSSNPNKVLELPNPLDSNKVRMKKGGSPFDFATMGG
jgi:hypothetical protein